MAATTRRPAPRRSGLFALDPYLIDECTFTRGEILRARGMVPRRRPARRPRSGRTGHAAAPSAPRTAA